VNLEPGPGMYDIIGTFDDIPGYIKDMMAKS